MVDSIARQPQNQPAGQESSPWRRSTGLGNAIGRLLPVGSALTVGLLVMLSLSGCGQFFAKTTTTTTTTTTTGSGDYFYVANSSTALDTVAGFSLSSGALSATTSSPYQLGVTPSSLALTPSNSILYVGSELGGIYGYLVGSTGGLTLIGSSALASTSVAAMAVDSTGDWLLVLQYGSTNPVLSAFPINTTTGTLSNASSTVTLDTGSAGSLLLVPGSTLVYASLGTGGVDALTFDSSTGTLTKLNVLLNPSVSGYSDNGLAADPDGKFLYVTETGINGIRSFTINSDGTLTALPGSPTAAGHGIGAVIVDKTGAFLYAANSADNTISAYTISSTGALTAMSGSPFATGSGPYSLAEDTTKGYLAVSCIGGSPDLQLFTITASTGALVSAITQSTGSTSPAVASVVVASH